MKILIPSSDKRRVLQQLITLGHNLDLILENDYENINNK